ncbi:MAG: hypothetical protein C5B47_04255 [Verrucomicrobia bacterium]|nr:MAG: hypothetical protein C5B47_04255 [Verrucomicrobiota bacterium]
MASSAPTEKKQASVPEKSKWLFPPQAGAAIEGLFIALLVLACAWTICFLIAHEAVKAQTRAIHEELERLAVAAATLVNGDAMARLTSPDQTGSAEYQATIAPLVRFHQGLDDLAYVYTLVVRDGKLHLILDTATQADQLGFRRSRVASRVMDSYASNSATEDAAQLRAVKQGRIYVSSEPYSGSWGAFITALAPIYNSQGDVVGAVGLDMELDGYLRRLNDVHSAGNLAMGIAFTIAAVVGIVIWQTRSRSYQAEVLRLRAQQARSEVERSNELLTRALGQIIYHRDILADHIDWQGNTHEVLGDYSWEVGSCINEWVQRIHPKDREKFYSASAHTPKHDGVFECEYRIRHASGSYVWVLDRGVRTLDRQGAVVMIDGILLDISLRKRVEDELARMALVVNRTDNAIVIADSKGRIEWINRAFSTLTGYNNEEVHGLKPGSFLQGPQSDPEIIKKISESLRKGVSCKAEILNYTKTGAQFWLDLEIQPLREPDGQLTGFMAIQTDVTARKLGERELIEAKESAEAAYRARSEFLAVMSHEIRTPLHSIIGFSNLLLHTNLDPQQIEYLEAIHASGDTLLDLLNDILDFSKMESEKLELEVRPTSVLKCIEDVLEVHAQAAATKGIELLEDVVPSIPEYIYSDAVRLRQILMNLIGNAVKFTHHGEIVVRVTSGAEPSDGLWKLIFEVCDTGIGISEESLSRLFHPFSQADSSTTRRYGGTGLGLAICRKLIHRMGGKIWVRSKPGAGSSFLFSLSVRAVPPPSGEPMNRKEPILAGAKIILLEDNVIKRQVISRQLQLWGAVLMACSTLEEVASRVVGIENIKAVIVDLTPRKIEDENFLPLLEKLFSNSLKVPMILLVPVDRNANVQALQKDKLVLSKPVRLEKLRSALLKAIETPEQIEAPVKVNAERRSFPTVKNVSVLVAEDNPVNQKLILRMLSLFEIQADLVDTGKACLESLAERTYDLIFMDVQMPEMDGYEATRHIREQGNRVWIVALTAHALQEDRERSLRAGMNAHLSKPIRLETLRTVIQEFLQHFPEKSG